MRTSVRSPCGDERQTFVAQPNCSTLGMSQGNPTPTAMPLDSPQTLINTGFAILRGALKRAFLDQVSLRGVFWGLLDSTRKQPCDYSQIAPNRERQGKEQRLPCPPMFQSKKTISLEEEALLLDGRRLPAHLTSAEVAWSWGSMSTISPNWLSPGC